MKTTQLNLHLHTEEQVVLQQLSHVYEEHQVFSLLEDGRVFHCTPDNLAEYYGIEAESGEVTLLVLESEDPRSQAFATTISNAGLLSRRAYPAKEVRGTFRRIDTHSGSSYETVDKVVHDARGLEITVKIIWTGKSIVSLPVGSLVGHGGQLGYRIAKEAVDNLKVWEPSFATSSQTRKGEIVAKRREVSYADLFERIGFDIVAHESVKDGIVSIKSVDKMGKRVKQTASSSRPRPFMVGFTLKSEEAIPFDVRGKEVMAQLLTMTNEAEVEAKILIADDFSVRMQVETMVPVFSSKGFVAQKQLVWIDKEVTDGTHYMTRSFAIANGLADENGNLRSGEQFRWGPSVKGLLVFVDSLPDVDVILFKGGIKGDAVVPFRNGHMDFAVLNNVRKEEVSPALKLSRQVLSAIQTPAMVAGLTEDTLELINKVLSYDTQSIHEFLSIREIEEDGEEELDIDQLTTSLYSVAPKTFMKSHAMKKKLADLLNSALQQFAIGAKLYLKEAKFAHMVSDVYPVIEYMRQGILGVDKAQEFASGSAMGIAPDHAVVTQAVESDGKLSFRYDLKAGAVFRFPFLHKLEGRVLNETTNFFLDKEAKRYYDAMVKRGHAQGLVFYSIWDMNAEGQSGADYDGDQTVWTTNAHILDNFKQSILFLDYSLVEQEDGEIKLVSGCPFPGETLELNTLFNDKELARLAELEITLKGASVSASEDLRGTPSWINAVGAASARYARATLVGNSIGRYTNISLTVAHITNELEAKLREAEQAGAGRAIFLLKQEIQGYRKLNFALAVAIRWEVDKAKHGGAYIEHLPFLRVFDETAELFNYERDYKISLQRLMYGDVRNELSKELKKAGIAPIAKRTTDVNGNELRRIKLDAHTYKAKKELKGVVWESDLNMAADRIEEFLAGKIKKLNLSSDYYENLLPELNGFINSGLSTGLITEADIAPFIVEDDSMNTPAGLLTNFASDVSTVSTQIGAEVSDLIQSMILAGFTHNFMKESERWVIEFARRKRVLTSEQETRIAQLHDKKERIMAYYKGQADLFKAGTSDLSGAFAFAILWKRVLDTQISRAEKADAKTLEANIALFEKKFGVSPKLNPAHLALVKASTPKYQLSRLSSVLNLFPAGALQFLNYIENGKVTEFSNTPRNMVGFFNSDTATADDIARIKSFEGSQVIMAQGRVIGSPFQLSKSGYNDTGFETKTPLVKMLREGYSKEAIEHVTSIDYLRGSQAFTDGYQIATVRYVETTRDGSFRPYSSGVRLWLSDMVSISKEDILKLINKK